MVKQTNSNVCLKNANIVVVRLSKSYSTVLFALPINTLDVPKAGGQTRYVVFFSSDSAHTYTVALFFSLANVCKRTQAPKRWRKNGIGRSVV